MAVEMAPKFLARWKEKFDAFRQKPHGPAKAKSQDKRASGISVVSNGTTRSTTVFDNFCPHNQKFSKMCMSVGMARGQPSEDQPARLVFERFLREDKRHEPELTMSYSFDMFLKEVESQFNAIYPDKPVETKRGFFSYSDVGLGYSIPKFDDQPSFEVALNTLYNKEAHDAMVDIWFEPESDEARDARVTQEQKDEEQAENDRALENQDLQAGDLEIDALFSRHTQRKLSEPAPIGHSKAAEKDCTREGSTGHSSPTFRSDIRDAGVVTTFKKQAPRPILREKETEEQRRERFKSLWEETERVLYQKDGEGDHKDEAEDEFISRQKDEQDEGSVIVPDEDEEEDGEIAQEDRAVIKLRKLLDMPDLQQLYDKDYPADPLLRWKICASMFCIDPNKTGFDDLITIAGLKTKIYQYQAFGIYWQMSISRRYGGGFVADDMGLGKTLSFLAYMVVERQLSVLWERVNKSRALKDGVHCPENDDPESRIVCNAPRLPGWIACPCFILNPTHIFEPKPGLRMACVPQALVRNWWDQWKTHIDTSIADLAFNIIIDHPGAFDNRSTVQDLQCKSDSARLNSRAAAEKYKGKGKGDDSAKPYQDGMLLVTTKETYPKWVKRHTYAGDVRVVAGDTDTWKKGDRINLVFGIAMIDESHEEPFKNQGRAKVLYDLPRTNNPFLWGYSGTLISQSPRGIEGVLWAIEKHNPRSRKSYEGGDDTSMETFDRICKNFMAQKDIQTRDDREIEAILEAYKPFLRTFVLRRDGNTRWFGHPLIKLKPHVHLDVKLRQKSPFYTSKDIEDFEAAFQSERDELLGKLQHKYDNEPSARRTNIRPVALAFNMLCRTQWRSSLLATFPWLLKLGSPTAASPMALTDIEVLQMRGSANKEKDNGYYQNLTRIVENSPKALWLFEFIKSLESRKDVNGEEEKLIVITQFPQIAFIMKLFLQKYFPGQRERIGLVTGRMPLKVKSEVINAFTGKDKGNSKLDIKILIGTTRLLGVGLQLTRACNLVLMEPDHHFARELQAYARVHRIGQRNPLSFSYRLIDEASEIEQRVLKRQADRRESPGRRVEGEGLNSSTLQECAKPDTAGYMTVLEG